jgi:predicted membrane protein
MRNTKRILWGIIFVAAAVLMITSSLGYLHGIGFWQIAFSFIWGALVISGIMNLSPFSIFFGFAFLSIVWDSELGIEELTPWPVLFAALFLTIGVYLIFGSKTRHYKKNWEKKYVPKGSAYENGERIYVKTKFGGSEKYIESDKLVSLDIDTRFGGTEVFMDKATAAGDTVVVRVNCVCGGIELRVPHNWYIENQTNCTIGGVDFPHRDSAVNDVKMILVGSVKLGGIELI